jgi:hypothetical protein
MLKKVNRRRSEEAIPCSLLLLLGWVAASSFACVHQTPPSDTKAKCPADLVKVNAPSDAPVKLRILGTECLSPYFVKVDFQVESATERGINRYEVHLVTLDNDKVENDTSTSLTETQPGEPLFTRDQMRSDSFGVSLKKSWADNPKPSLALSVTSVTFLDGTIWKLPGT